MFAKIPKLLFFILLMIFSFQKEPNTFSNYEQIKLFNIEANFDIDFEKKVIHSTLKLYLKAEEDGEVIILDNNNLNIITIVDSNTGDELEFIFDELYEIDSLGIPIKIYKDYKKGDLVTLLVIYETKEESTAVQWLEKEQTEGKKYPYMFTECFSIAGRQLLPTQDTPLVKTTVSMSITVIKPLFALFSGIYKSSIDNGETKTYFYEQTIPIPSYLIAIAVGNIEERIISDRTKVYAEPEIVDKAAWEFEETENFLEIGEAYTIPYEWKEYNLLILPSSFPFGGMENPTLTFVTPSLIAGDRSLANVVAHEICHSWSGNLVTMNNWSDFWLNEGFTMFLERKITEKTKDEDIAKLDAMIGYDTMINDIKAMGESKSFSSLKPYLLGRNPDDAFSEIPYEKGFNFMYYLEKLINSYSSIDLFRKILRQYFTKFKYQSINYQQFKEHLIEVVQTELGTDAQKVLNQIDWKNWVEEPGIPKYKNDFSNKYTQEVSEAVDKFYKNELTDDFIIVFKNWDNLLKSLFLKNIRNNNLELDETQHMFLNSKLNLKEGYNAGINFNYFMIVLTHIKNITEEEYNKIIEFLGAYGLLSYCRNLYSALYKINKELALETFKKYRNRYHPMVIRLIEEEFKHLS